MIDYNTLNIVFGVNKGGDEIRVFLPPVSSEEIKKNALVLGQFAGFMRELNDAVLLTDWEEYLYLSCEKVSKISSFRTDQLHNDVRAMLERGIVGGYYYDNFTPLALKDVDDEELKKGIMASLLFFIVARRYIFRMMGGDNAETLKKFGYELTSSTATDYGTTLEKSLKEEKSSTEAQ